MEKAELTKKIFVRGILECKTGLHIGGSDQALSIGGVDNVVVRDPTTGFPYIPGSSIKGKMRSLLEKFHGLIDQENQMVYVPKSENDKKEGLMIGKIFGLPAESKLNEPARLIVRDAFMTDDSVSLLKSLETDLPYTEVKTEVTINRLTSKANPRQMERVPANTKFNFEMVVNIYEEDNEKEILGEIFNGLTLIQDDYLGGSGSRGYGKVKFTITDITYKDKEIYKELEEEKPYNVQIQPSLK